MRCFSSFAYRYTKKWGFSSIGGSSKAWLLKGLILDDLGYPHFWKGYVGGVGSTTKWWLSLFSSSLVILWWHMCLFVWYVSFWFILRILSSFLYPYSVHSPEKHHLDHLEGASQLALGDMDTVRGMLIQLSSALKASCTSSLQLSGCKKLQPCLAPGPPNPCMYEARSALCPFWMWYDVWCGWNMLESNTMVGKAESHPLVMFRALEKWLNRAFFRVKVRLGDLSGNVIP